MLLVGSFFSHLIEDIWLLSVVCLSLDCLYSAGFFGVVYYMMALPLTLDLLPPSMVYTHLNHMRKWVWVLSFSFL